MLCLPNKGNGVSPLQAYENILAIYWLPKYVDFIPHSLIPIPPPISPENIWKNTYAFLPKMWNVHYDIFLEKVEHDSLVLMLID